MKSPYHTIMKNIHISDEKNIQIIIKDRYRLLNFKVEKEDFDEGSIENLERNLRAMKLSLAGLTLSKLIEYAFVVLYLTYIILICGIDKENRKVNKFVNIYGIAISIMYMSYLCIVEEASIYRYGIYLIFHKEIIFLWNNNQSMSFV